MKTYVPLFEEYTGKHLIVVDVQEAFAKWWIKNGKPNLPDLIRKYAEKFDYVYQIWDDTKAQAPSYKFPNEIKAIKKTYGGQMTQDVINKYFDGDNQIKIQKDFDAQKYPDTMYPAKDGSVFFYVGLSHEWFHATSEMFKFFESLQNLNTEIILVGGAVGECIEDVAGALHIMEIPHKIEHLYTYHA